MNEFAFLAGDLLNDTMPRLDPVETALFLAQMPSKPIGYSSPEHTVRALFDAPNSH